MPFRNKNLNQNSVETLYAGKLGHHCTKISENYIKNCRRSSIWRDPLIMRFFVHSSAARGHRWMKLQTNEFEPRWVLTTKFHPSRSTRSGWTGENTGQNDRQTNKQTDTSTDNKGCLKLSGACEPIFAISVTSFIQQYYSMCRSLKFVCKMVLIW